MVHRFDDETSSDFPIDRELLGSDKADDMSRSTNCEVVIQQRSLPSSTEAAARMCDLSLLGAQPQRGKPWELFAPSALPSGDRRL